MCEVVLVTAHAEIAERARQNALAAQGLTPVTAAVYQGMQNVSDQTAASAIGGGDDDNTPSTTSAADQVTSNLRAQQQAPVQQSAAISVDFANAPRGTRVSASPQNTADVDLSVGYQMGFTP